MAVSAKDVMDLRARTNAPMMECRAALESTGGDIDKAVKVLRERGIAKQEKRLDRETKEGAVKVMVGPGNRGGAAVMLTCETDFSARNENFQKLAGVCLEAARQAGESATPESVQSSASVKGLYDDVANTIRENMTLRQVSVFGGICGSYVHFDGKKGALVEVEGGDASPATAEILRELCMHVVATVPAPLAVDVSGIPASFLDQEREIAIARAIETGKPKEIAEKIVAGQLKKVVAERALVEQPYIKNPDQTVSAWLASRAKSAGLGTLKVRRFARLEIGG